jgi:GNAT superfamily N-acetyltransferase
MPTTTIRAARASDAHDIARLTADLGYDVTAEEAARRVSRILGRDDQQLFVADEGEAVAGWVHVLLAEYVDAEPFVVIGGLVVSPDHRREGIGRALMERAEAWASEQGCAIVRLSSTITRHGAHRFYERLGYTIIKTQYSFIKPLDASAAARLATFVPRVDSTE